MQKPTYHPRYAYNRPPGYGGDLIAVQVNLTANEMDLIARNGEYRTPAVRDALAVLVAAQDKARIASDALSAAVLISDETERTARQEALAADLAAFQAEAEAANAALDATIATELARRAALLAQAFGKRTYTLDGLTLDFTSGPAALDTLTSPDLPRDVIAWLGLAVGSALEWDEENIRKNSSATWTTGVGSKSSAG